MSLPSFCKLEQNDLKRVLRRWFSLPAGIDLVGAENRLLTGLSEDLFGYYLVQVQDFGHGLEAFSDCAVKNKILLDLSAIGCTPDMLAQSEHLPLASDSVDVVVLPHTLDFSRDPHQVLREVERVLIPEGRVLIVGFNPFSLWGLWRLFLRWRGAVPWCGHFLAYRRVTDWLSLLGFDIERTDVCAFMPPLSSSSWKSGLRFMQDVSRRIWPMFAGVYAVRAVKRVSTIRPVKMRWQGLRVLGPRTIESPTMSPYSDGCAKNVTRGLKMNINGVKERS